MEPYLAIYGYLSHSSIISINLFGSFSSISISKTSIPANFLNKTAFPSITGFAASNLGDVVYVELPEVGATVTQFSKMGEIESVKAVSDLYSPISGAVKEINEALNDNPEWINNNPFEDGRMIKIALSDLQETDNLLTASEYEELIAAEDG